MLPRNVPLARWNILCARGVLAGLMVLWSIARTEDARAQAQPSVTYHEAPMLAQRVARGELPPVEQRLPEKPMVVEPVESVGKYGGTWRRLAVGPGDIHLVARLGYESLVRWDRTGRKVVPGLAESWEILDEGRRYVFHLRPGVRWSDGEPFTSDDFMFWYKDVLTNKELTPVPFPWLVVDGVVADVQAPDTYTVEFRFAKPYGIFLEQLAFNGRLMLTPKHHLKQFHPRYADPAAIQAAIQKTGTGVWQTLFQNKNHPDRNPDLPVLGPFQLKTSPSLPRVIAERNPYYWKVDPAGNQLPYLDEIAYIMVQNGEILNIKAMTGEADFQDRRIDAANFPLFMENRRKGKYRVLRDENPTPTVLYLNQYSKDPAIRSLLQDRRFRIALSLAVNRQELIDLIYSGMAKPSRGVSSPFDRFYLPEYDAKYLEYDPDQANRLLDEVGLTCGSDGMRRMPDGKPFRQILNVFPSETGVGIEIWQLVADYFREIGLDFVVKMDSPQLSVLQIRNGNSDFWAYNAVGLHWIVDPIWYVPWGDTSYFAPLYGRYRSSKGKIGVKPPEEFQRLIDWYLELTSVVNDESRRLELGRRILGQWADECYTVGICRNELLTIVSDRFKNVPEDIIHDYRVMTPGYIGIEQFYIDEGS